MAPFGTKSAQTQAVEATVANMVLSDEPTVEVGQETRTDQELQSLDVEWKKVLSMGDMVDVQDKNGIWYQV